MKQTIIHDLRAYIDILKKESELIEINVAVDPYLEIAEIHRRVIRQGGPALLFTNVKGSAFSVVTNLFGTGRRLELAFGRRPQQFVTDLVNTAETIMPPSFGKIWAKRSMLRQAIKVGLKSVKHGSVLENCQSPPRLTEFPLLTSWATDGGPFVTLPLVYTEDPDGRGHNLGMYRIQRYDDSTAGIHWQIHKGGGYHYLVAEKRNENLPATLFIGGPPALMLAAIAPLPENIPELVLASLLLGEKLAMVKDPAGGHPLVASAEFAAKGYVPPHMRRPEGPFGDHYGYNSLVHDYPVFHIDRIYHRKDAVYPATIVGRPRQEDFFIGDFLQDLLSPLFPLVMCGVKELKTFGEAGFHCLAAAKVQDRYPREAFAAGLRILGEGQLSLTKFLIITDGDVDITDFKKLWLHILERVNWQSDLFVFANVSQDTLDYTGPKVNSGSKALLMGLGKEPCRVLSEFFKGELPQGCTKPIVYLPGTLVIEGNSYESEQELAQRLSQCESLADWQVILLVDDSAAATVTVQEFIWTFFTRFEPAGDIYAAKITTNRLHVGLQPPLVIDCRMKPWYPPILEVDAATKKLVDDKIKDILPSQWR